ncbi:primase-helicase family protein [Carboxylicivirga marina]|uniref:primase-helicase family protein n=1 Tax=Carboxylicivirga marina TaxID=2800988 RepID=UPI00259176CC|nr:DUF5906 domain-containing protein [uncultured Carboxylicivirga sp.]
MKTFLTPASTSVVYSGDTFKPYSDFFHQRVCVELGVTREQNKIKLCSTHDERTLWFDGNVFSEDEDGNIRILVYGLDRETIQIRDRNADPTRVTIANNRTQNWYITRLKHPKRVENKDGSLDYRKYLIPKGAGTYPFFPPHLVKKFEDKEKVKTLFLTEGYFKAFKGGMHGMDIVGLSSISHYRQKETQQMYKDVVELIRECDVENVVMIYDGDCLDISTTALEKGNDLYKRPASFFASARNLSELLKDFDVSVYWSMIKSQEIDNHPKGIDDLMIELRGEEEDIINDACSLSRPGRFFDRKNITRSVNKLYKTFAIGKAETFYNAHADVIGSSEFVFNGTKYKFNYEKNLVEIIQPKEAKNYFRVGDVYYEYVEIPNQNEQLEKYFHKRSKETIREDHGKDFMKHIAKYKAFCNVPNNVSYQPVIHNCFNVFHPFAHTPEEGDCPKTMKFLQHIFQEHLQLGIDYVQILFQRPTQILPILCLVSRENSTGKSTFAYWLKEIFAANMAIVGNAELNDSFNGAWATKQIVACDEAFIEKKSTVERIKMLSTARKITLRMMQKDGEEIDFFGKFILISNNEENFIYATEEDIRYWVRKVPRIKQDEMDPRLMDDLVDEIPAFLHFLNNRTLSTENKSRMWFDPKAIETEALMRVRKQSRPAVEKMIRSRIKNMFLDFGDITIMMSINDIVKELCNNRYDANYVDKILRENIGVDNYKKADGKRTTKRYSYPKWDVQYTSGKQEKVRVDVSANARPFVFNRQDFVKASEEVIYTKDTEEVPLPSEGEQGVLHNHLKKN